MYIATRPQAQGLTRRTSRRLSAIVPTRRHQALHSNARATAGLDDFVRRHRGITNDHHFVVVTKLVHDVVQSGTLVVTPNIVFPNVVVEEVVKVEMLKVLELAACGRKQLLADFDVWIHRTAYV